MTITLAQSFDDWWNTPAILQQPTTRHSLNNESFTRARTKNIRLERHLFENVFKQDTYTYDFIDTEVDRGVFIHEVCLTPKQSIKGHVVVVHGFMAAMGYFLYNLEALTAGGTCVHAIDLPGFGNSAHPKFPRVLLEDTEEKIPQIKAAEKWFIDRIERWRNTREIEQFDLIGHSMGGYLASCYVLEYGKEVVTKLILLSPMGTEESEASLLNGPHHPWLRGQDPTEEVLGTKDDRSELWQKLGGPKFPKNFVVNFIWKHHLSPVGILHTSGPLFSKLLSFWTYKRFANNPPDVIDALHNYSYSIFYQYSGSGEVAITKLVNPAILPYIPLCQRGLPQWLAQHNVPLLVIYGDKDWMNIRGGQHLVDETITSGGQGTFVLLKHSGHHMYLDNPTECNHEVVQFLNKVE